jgi:DNA-binding transcriptional MocR family regulator
VYKQLTALIEAAIEQGRLENARLPPERRLCELLGVSRSTVARALNELTDRGMLIRRQGSGTCVNREKWGLQQYPILNWQPPATARASRESQRFAEGIRLCREQAAVSGKAVLDLSGSDLPADLLPHGLMPESPWSQELWREALRQELDAESSLTGLASFRESVQRHLADSLALDVPREQILITSGVQQALFLITQCLLRPGDAVGIEAPSYFYSLPVFQAAGLRLFAIPLDREGIDMHGLEALASRRDLKMIFLNPVFQNPTGTLISQGRKEAVLRFCSARHIPVVEDDSYSRLAFCPQTDIYPIKALDRHGQVLYIGSLSSYVGKNIRAGWLVAPKSVAEKLADVRSQADAGLSVLPQLLAAHYLDAAYQDHIAFLRQALADRAKALRQLLFSVLPELPVPDAPRGGFYLYLQADAGRESELAGALLTKGIIPARGTDFGDTGGTFRLNFAHIRPSCRVSG